MGAGARLFVFDHARYMQEIVPAMRSLYLDGRVPGWLLDELRAQHARAARWAPLDVAWLGTLARLSRGLDVDLSHDCDLLAPDLSPARPLDPDMVPFGDWPARACRSATCPAAPRCPLHGEEDALEWEALWKLFRWMVVSRTLGQSQFIGRNENLVTFLRFLVEEGAWEEGEEDTELVTLFRRLGLRGFHVGWAGADSDGIHGWLSPEETARFAELLDTELDLPALEPSFEAMAATLTTFDDGSKRFHVEDVERPRLLMAFVRTTAQIAAAGGMGVLLGLDLDGGGAP